NLLPDVRPRPHARASIGLHDLPRGADGPAGAVGELDDVVERIDELDLAALHLVVGPLLAAVPGAGDVRLEARSDRVLLVARRDAEERRQVEEVEELGALEERLGLLLPGLAAILRPQDLAELAHDPTVLAVDELDVVEDRVGGGEALPAGAIPLHRPLSGSPG